MKAQSINDEVVKTVKINKSVRVKIAAICKTVGKTHSEKLQMVRNYLKNCKEVKAIVMIGNTINVHTSGECASTYTYSI